MELLIGEAYEQERQRRIAENKALLSRLNIQHGFFELPQQKKQARTKKIKLENSDDEYKPAPRRRSTRFSVQKSRLVSLTDSSSKDSSDNGGQKNYRLRNRKRNSVGGLGKRNPNPGRRIQGGRIYDSELGTTCHQCRQKTIEEKIRCTNELEEGQMCRVMLDERCLMGRYGENLEEARKTGEWICPKCRDICNCSFCRRKKGLAPTGLLKSIALRKDDVDFNPFIKNEDIESDTSLVQTNIKRENPQNCRFQEIPLFVETSQEPVIEEATLGQSDQLVPSRDETSDSNIINDDIKDVKTSKEERPKSRIRSPEKEERPRSVIHSPEREELPKATHNYKSIFEHVNPLFDYENDSGLNPDSTSDDEVFSYGIKKEDTPEIVSENFSKCKNFTGLRHQMIKQENEVSQVINPLFISSQDMNPYIKNEGTYPFIKDEDVDWDGFQDNVCVLIDNRKFNSNAYILK
ncbi:9157_t:CDS:2 [Ambispora leptoticha]|uniref:9157_t:CDS:1 n=1 Tax=Ambispora leptoticha TaxID=144679 RepID=A0A9N9AZP1_9GLOM|nr:9157_t:CDS:2 [Ambispora leptoticha]